MLTSIMNDPYLNYAFVDNPSRIHAMVMIFMFKQCYYDTLTMDNHEKQATIRQQQITGFRDNCYASFKNLTPSEIDKDFNFKRIKTKNICLF